MADLYITFTVSDCIFALPVSQVREVVRAAALSDAVSKSGSVEGLLNLRGQTVPVINLAAICDLPQTPLAETDFLVITKCEPPRLVAFRSDSPIEMSETSEESVESGDLPQIAKGLLRVGQRIATLVDVQKVETLIFDAPPLRTQDQT